MSIIGIDPGAHGAIVILGDDGVIMELYDMPVNQETKGRMATNAVLLSKVIYPYNASRVFCEFVGARPTDAKVSAFAFGRARGVIEGVCGALNLPITFVTPQTWKRFAGIPPGKENKDLARSRAIAIWPAYSNYFKRKMDVDRAEACLIGLAGLKLSTNGVGK